MLNHGLEYELGIEETENPWFLINFKAADRMKFLNLINIQSYNFPMCHAHLNYFVKKKTNTQLLS